METGGKPRLYFDTTMPNYLFVDDRPDEREATRRLWEKCVGGDYDREWTKGRVKEVNEAKQYKEIGIMPPDVFLEGGLRMTVRKTLEEVRRIKEECSRERLARTPEEQRLENQRLKAWFEEWIGRPIKTVNYSRRGRATDEEPARV
jgi:predicted nucleic acid-binding protein